MYPSRLNLKKVFDCLVMWNETDSVLTDLMNMVMTTLQSAIYINPKMKDVYTKILPIIDNNDLKTLVDDFENHVPYYSVLSVIVKELTKHGQLKFHRSPDDIARIEELEKLEQQMLEEITGLKKEIEARPSPEEYQAVLTQLQNLKEQNDNFKGENFLLKHQLKERIGEADALRKQVLENGDQIDHLSNKVSDLELEKELMQQDIIKYQQRITIARDGLVSFKNVKDKLIVKLGTIKSQIINLQRKNEALATENAKLTVRASMGFENLTPRPNYNQFPPLKEFEAESELKERSNFHKSTIQIVESLVKKIQSFPRDHSEDSKENEGVGSRKSLKKESRSNSLKQISLTANVGLKPISERQGSKGSMKDVRKDGSETTKKLYKKKSSSELTPILKKTTSINLEERVSTRRSNESFGNEFPNTSRSQANYIPSLNKYVVQVESLKDEDENITEEDTIHITNELMGYIVEANKAVNQLNENI